MISPAQHIVSGFEGTKLTRELKTLVCDWQIAGVIFFRRNFQNPKQLAELVNEIQNLTARKLIISIDYEGGRVFRLKEPFTQIPPMQTVGHYLRRTKDTQTIESLAHVMARELEVLGINLNFAPVVDIHNHPLNPIIGDRAFATDPRIVIECAKHFCKASHTQNVLTCLKHYPGHGATLVDSHKELPIVDHSARLLWRRDFLPYKKLIPLKDTLAIMTAHVLYPDLDSKNMATFSDTILNSLLRKKLKFNGVVFSDDMFMQAIAKDYSLSEASAQFLKASGDIALWCHKPKLQIKELKKLEKLVKEDEKLQTKLKTSQKRKNAFLQKLSKTKPNFKKLDQIGNSEHLAIINHIKKNAYPTY